uniref:Uncharacterized protein n=1 Tax=Pyramimonas orientalis virus TaxID=455367 RepID=A0A7L9AXW5_POV01|nr:hypothetical protein HWQ62_00354 [Pyramimonas orientalis virus]
MNHSNVFNKHEFKFIEAIIKHIGENIDMDVHAAMELFGIKYLSNMDHMEKLIKTTTTQCRVKLNTDKQCSRSAKKNGFCMTHNKQFENKTLDKNKIIKLSELSKFETVVQRLRNVREIPKLINTKLIYFDSIEYLHDPHTNNVYDFDTYEKIGKVDNFRQLKTLTNV